MEIMFNIKSLYNIACDSFQPAGKTTIWLLKIMIPISFVVCLMEYYGIIAWCAQWLNPLFCHIGLPGASSIAFLTGATATTYAALAVMMTMQLTLRQATVIAIMVLICHALPLECTVNKKVGSKPFRMGFLRICGALLSAVFLNFALPEMSEPFSSSMISAEESTIGEVLRAWIASSLKLSAMIFAIIYALMFIQRFMEKYGLMQKLTKPLEPLMVLFGFFMTMVIELPSSLFDLAFGALYGSGRSLGAVAVLFQYSFTALLYLGFFIVISMTLMAAAYQYGTVSERIDIASLEGDIRNFENL